MATDLDTTKERALRLSNAERAELASELVASLDGPADADASQQWEDEILRRVRQIDLGGTEFLSVDDLRAMFRDRLNRH